MIKQALDVRLMGVIFNGIGEVVRLRAAGLSIERIARQMRLGVGTVVRVIQANRMTPQPSKTPQLRFAEKGAI